MNTVVTIARREYVERLKQRGFIIGTVLGVLLVVGLSLAPLLLNSLGAAFTTSVAILAPDQSLGQQIRRSLDADQGTYKLTVLPPRPTGPALPADLRTQLDQGKYDAALVVYYESPHQLAFAYYPEKSDALDKVDRLKRYLLPAVVRDAAARVHGINADRELNFGFKTVNLNKHYKNVAEETASQVLVYFLLLLMYISVIMYGIYVGQGVIEEKSNRVMELMIGAVRPSQLLAGKIIGIGSLALTQLVIIGGASLAIGAFAAATFGQGLVHNIGVAAPPTGGSNVLTVPIMNWVYLIVFFLLGFFTYATLFAGLGALASKPEDLQQTNGFFTFPIVIAYFLSLMALLDPEKPFVIWTSLIPMLSPMVMFARISTSDVPFWQIGISIVASLAAIWLFTLMAGKLYRIGVLMYGKPLAPKEVLRALRART